MYTIKRLTECTILEAVEAWNKGFEGYYSDATTTPERFVQRMVNEGLSPELSIVAFDRNKPIGIVLNGIRSIQNKKVAWNGGTGVAAAYRGKGVGKLLMDECLSIYKSEGVNIATLEAISENSKAIRLYEKYGYKITDRLEFLVLNGSLLEAVKQVYNDWKIIKTVPQETESLSFYQSMYPWQTHWRSARDGEAIILLNENHYKIGYAYFRRVFDNQNKHIATLLYQCEADPNRNNNKDIIEYLLSYIFEQFVPDIKRTVINIPIKSSSTTYSALKEIGFQTSAEQVYMIKSID